MFHGHRLVAAMREVVGDPDIESLPIPFIAVAVDLMRQREVWLRSGPLWRAIRASFAIPGLFTPALVHGRELVDGGLLAPLPITATRLSDAQRLIAVDMHGWPQRPSGDLPDEHADDDDGHGLAGWIGIQDTPREFAEWRSAIGHELEQLGKSVDDLDMCSMIWFVITDQDMDQTDAGKGTNILVGSERQITDKLKEYQEIGMTMPLLWPPFADVPVSKTLDDLKRLKNDIMPKVEAAAG